MSDHEETAAQALNRHVANCGMCRNGYDCTTATAYRVQYLDRVHASLKRYGLADDKRYDQVRNMIVG